MATFNQNFVKFQDDTFALIYTFTDLPGVISSWSAWWGASTTYGGTSILEKHTTWSNPVFTNNNLILNGNTATVLFAQSDFAADSIQEGGFTGTLNGGSGYTPSTTTNNVPLTGGTGQFAQASITTNSSGVVTNVVITLGGRGYAATDVLTLNGGGGSNATITLAANDIVSGPLEANTTYYHELVISPNGTEDQSIVVATGTFQVDPSQFSTTGYRP